MPYGTTRREQLRSQNATVRVQRLVRLALVSMVAVVSVSPRAATSLTQLALGALVVHRAREHAISSEFPSRAPRDFSRRLLSFDHIPDTLTREEFSRCFRFDNRADLGRLFRVGGYL